MNTCKTSELDGADLHYWVARANGLPDICRSHYGEGGYDGDKSSARLFVALKFGGVLPCKDEWK